ncbi:MAG: hypothetical protein HYX72_05300 [Acidobacteria bacterium]|nr:hypothetical protein [Acidobacteriota bacterium]
MQFMELQITPAVRRFYKQLASVGGKARAAKYDHNTLSEWAKLGGRPRKKAAQVKREQTTVARRTVVVSSGH